MPLASGLSFHRPKFCPTATWSPNGTTLANSSLVGQGPVGIFIQRNNSIFIPNRNNSHVIIWSAGNYTSPSILLTNSVQPYGIFITLSGDIYLDSGSPYDLVDLFQWNITSNTYAPRAALHVGEQCHGLFIDTNNSLYCSLDSSDRVIRRSLDSSSSQITTVAGAGCPGFLSNMLHSPQGIFVDTNFDLYVADKENHRVQLFPIGQSNAVTAAGRGAPGTIPLSQPCGVVLDADGYLFIADSDNDRIVGSGPDGFRCLIRCTGSWGSRFDELASPSSIAFDSYGTIFTTDTYNSRVQYFPLLTNSCSE